MFKQKEILKRIEDLEAKQEQLMSLTEKVHMDLADIKEECQDQGHKLDGINEKCDDLNIDDDRIKRAVKKAMAEYREEMETPKKVVKKK